MDCFPLKRGPCPGEGLRAFQGPRARGWSQGLRLGFPTPRSRGFQPLDFSNFLLGYVDEAVTVTGCDVKARKCESPRDLGRGAVECAWSARGVRRGAVEGAWGSRPWGSTRRRKRRKFLFKVNVNEEDKERDRAALV